MRSAGLCALHVAPLVGALLIGALVSGCCTTPPPAEKYFSRSHPMQTAWLFRYAIETRQYQAAWESLIPADREQISVLKLGLAMRHVAPPAWGDVTVEEFLREAQWMTLDRDRSDAGEAWVSIWYDREGGEEYIQHSFKLVRRPGEQDWLIDIAESLVPR